jgi:hypothetical protein
MSEEKKTRRELQDESLAGMEGAWVRARELEVLAEDPRVSADQFAAATATTAAMLSACALRAIAHTLAGIEDALREMTGKAEDGMDHITVQVEKSSEWINKRLESIAGELESGRRRE